MPETIADRRPQRSSRQANAKTPRPRIVLRHRGISPIAHRDRRHDSDDDQNRMPTIKPRRDKARGNGQASRSSAPAQSDALSRLEFRLDRARMVRRSAHRRRSSGSREESKRFRSMRRSCTPPRRWRDDHVANPDRRAHDTSRSRRGVRAIASARRHRPASRVGKAHAAVDSRIGSVFVARSRTRNSSAIGVEPPDLGNSQPAPGDHRVVGRVAYFDFDRQVRRRLDRRGRCSAVPSSTPRVRRSRTSCLPRAPLLRSSRRKRRFAAGIFPSDFQSLGQGNDELTKSLRKPVMSSRFRQNREPPVQIDQSRTSGRSSSASLIAT